MDTPGECVQASLSVVVTDTPTACTFEVSTLGAFRLISRCAKRVRRFWAELRTKLRSVSPKPYVGIHSSLFVPVKILIGEKCFLARALIDTGASFPLILGKGLLPEGLLRGCNSLVRLLDASRATMKGGSQGASVRIALPVVENRQGGDCTVEALCSPLWAVEVSLPGLQLVIGYPFLSLFRLMVDPVAHCLRFGFASEVGTSPDQVVPPRLVAGQSTSREEGRV